MTENEFKKWFAYHASCFTGIHTWLAKIPVVATEEGLCRAGVLEAWCRTLAHVDADAAKEATDALFLGTEDEPKAYDRHPATIVRIARAHTKPISSDIVPRMVDDEWAYNCLQCHDTGIISCWHPKSMYAMRDGTFGQAFTAYSCTTACTC